MDIPFNKQQELKTYLEGQITDEQIEELIELGIVNRPKNTGSTSNNYHPERDDDQDPDSSGGTAGSGSGGTQSAGGQRHQSSGTGTEERKISTSSTNDKTYKQTLTFNASLASDAAIYVWLSKHINVGKRTAPSLFKKQVTPSFPQGQIKVQSQ